jgi:hypothetical protein
VFLQSPIFGSGFARANPPTGAGSMDFMMKALPRTGKHPRRNLEI